MVNKYHNKKIIAGGQTFDSKREYNRWQALRLLERAGKIKDLKRQVKYELIPAQCEPDTVGPKGGHRKGKTLERPVYYIADFVYTENGIEVVEDCKGMRTDVYKLKRKLMLYRYGIKIKET